MEELEILDGIVVGIIIESRFDNILVKKEPRIENVVIGESAKVDFYNHFGDTIPTEKEFFNWLDGNDKLIVVQSEEGVPVIFLDLVT